jgi:hypothetical protein
MGSFIDLTGQLFSKLKVIQRGTNDQHNKITWICQCECGNEKIVLGKSLKNGNVQSCGCMRSYHGKTHTSEYKIWKSIHQRCNNTKANGFDKYGGRGIKVCERWSKSFNNFLEDMGERPSITHSIDRIDVNGNYEPSNCRWATPAQQSRNIRPSINSKTGACGVYYHKDGKRCKAFIKVNKKQIYLGSFDNLEDAIEERRRAEKIYWE